MIRPGYWSILISIVLIVFCCCPALADEIYPTVTDVFFEKDGLPFHEPIAYTMNCYGVKCEQWDCKGPNDNWDPAQHSDDLVYSYHASCQDYGCRIHEPYYHTERLKVDHCDIAGMAGGEPFLIRNYSRSPLPACRELHQFHMGKGNGEYYRVTPEYDECLNESYKESDLCDIYMKPCSPAVDTDCGNWVINDSYVKDTPKSQVCRDNASEKRHGCDAYLVKVDPATMVMWKDAHSGDESPAMRSCELRIEIPSDNASTSVADSSETPGNHVTKTDSGSLWCGLLQFFGRACE